MKKNLYNVVTKDKITGVMTRMSFLSKMKFDKWYNSKMLDGSGKKISEEYEIVAQGISPEEASDIAAQTPNSAYAKALAYQISSTIANALERTAKSIRKQRDKALENKVE